MTLQADLGHVDLRVPLEKLVTAVTERMQEAGRESFEPSEPDDLLHVLDNYVSRPLMHRAEAAGPSSVATWHLAHLALAIVDRAGMPEEGAEAGPYERVNMAR